MSRVHSMDHRTSAGLVKRIAGPMTTRVAPDTRAQKAEIRNILRGPAVQAKLTVSEPGDEYEREADRVADEVMRMPDDSVASVSAAPQGVQRMCAECEEDSEGGP